ncbi:hypothetical protein [Aliagarivorans taiwanensis]|uniref:hypothetical protein n=1 Tax=Aliagarivorans taiwanensis TaxID=561966 RepID=UPI0003FBAA30|nr:hypothetical protein [Aliagarivorans taiwanensis]
MQFKLMLNGRKYRINDDGEGDAVLMVFHSGQDFVELELLKRYQNNRFRILVIDISQAWPIPASQMTVSQLESLADDVHLFADINWLDKLTLLSSGSGHVLYPMLKQRLKQRLQLANLVNEVESFST